MLRAQTQTRSFPSQRLSGLLAEGLVPRSAETDIDTGAYDARRLFDVDECRAQSGNLRRERNLLGAEVVVVVFNKAGQDVGEGIFAANPDGPSGSCFTRNIGRSQHDRRGPKFITLPGATTLDVAKEAIPGI